MDENYPIDIHYNKLLDWLLSRRHCEQKWHIQSKAIRSRVSVAIKELPRNNDELEKILLDETRLTYFECKEVLAILKHVDGDGKTLFGQYTAPRVKEWADIAKAYEQGNAFLAECGQQLARMVNYDIPHVKHQISRSQQVVRDCLRQEEELRAAAASFKEKYESSCQEMGIKGMNVKAELSQLLSQLPEVYERVLELLPNLLPCITFYQRFLNSIGSSVTEDEYLPMLSFVLKNGNVTVYQWKHGEIPVPDHTQCNGNETEEPSIDWGLDSTEVVSREDGGIDFGEIDFGDVATGEVEEGEVVITLEESGVGGVAMEGCVADAGSRDGIGGVTDHVSEQVGGVADQGSPEGAGDGGKSAVKTSKEYNAVELQLLLENPATRNMLLDDLLELREFLSQRIREMSADSASTLQMFCVEEFGMESSSDDMAAMLDHVTAILGHMTNKRVQHLFHMKGSQRYLQRLSEDLCHNLRLSNRATSQGMEAVVRREQADVTIATLQPQYTALVGRAKKLQSQMSDEISTRYSNRVVNIMGEINQI